MGASIQTLILHAAKRGGGFTLARRYTRRGLRIVCFHGMSLADEHCWNPDLFMPIETFRRRLEIIASMRLPVVRLQDVVAGTYPDNAVVITFDDGWTGTMAAAAILKEYGFPSTLYASTYYLQTGRQVFNVLVPYLLWKTTLRQFRVPRFGKDLEVAHARRPLEEMGETLSGPERQAFAEELADVLHVAGTRDLFRFISAADAIQLQAMGMQLELHTHRHQWRRDDAEWNTRELLDNRAAIEAIGCGVARHLCYPSGVFSETQYKVLEKLDVVTATTCERGLNFASTHRYEMNRYLDSDAVAAIKFEAELAGVLDIVRAPTRLLGDSRQAFRAPVDRLVKR